MKPYYHGTDAQLEPGHLILPGCVARFNLSAPRRVYFTGDLLWALGYAVAFMPELEPHVYRVMPTARKVHRDVSVFCGQIDRKARWSGRPLVVVEEVAIPRDLARRMALIVAPWLSEEVAA